jgi:hypothetical protein
MARRIAGSPFAPTAPWSASPLPRGLLGGDSPATTPTRNTTIATRRRLAGPTPTRATAVTPLLVRPTQSPSLQTTPIFGPRKLLLDHLAFKHQKRWSMVVLDIYMEGYLHRLGVINWLPWYSTLQAMYGRGARWHSYDAVYFACT